MKKRYSKAPKDLIDNYLETNDESYLNTLRVIAKSSQEHKKALDEFEKLNPSVKNANKNTAEDSSEDDEYHINHYKNK